MVGIVERNEALRVLGREIDFLCVVDADDVVDRRMEDQQGAPQMRDDVAELLRADVVEELLFDAKRTSDERNFRLALRFDAADIIAEIIGDMARIGRRTDGADGFDLIDLRGGCENRGTAKRMADQHFWCRQSLPHVVGGRDEITDVGGKVGICELAFACTEAGEIKSQHGNAVCRQAFGNPAGGEYVLGTCKAVREERISANVALRQVQPCREHVAESALKLNLFAICHV